MPLTRRQFFSRSACLLPSLTAFAVSGCSRSEPVKIGSHPWIGYEFLHLSHRLGKLPDSIHFTEYRNASEVISGLVNQQIDVATLSLDEVLIAQTKGVPLTVVMIFDISAGADMVLAPEHIQQLSDIKGQRIGYEAGAHGQFILAKLLEAANLTLDDISATPIPPHQQYDQWKNNQIDVAISYQPYAHPFLSDGFRVLFDSRQLPNMNYNVLAVRTEKLTTLNGSITNLTNAHFKMLKLFQNNPSDMLYEITNTIHNKIPINVIKQGLRGIALPSLNRNRAMLADQETLKTIISSLTPYINTPSQQIIYNIDNLFTTKYLPEKVASDVF